MNDGAWRARANGIRLAPDVAREARENLARTWRREYKMQRVSMMGLSLLLTTVLLALAAGGVLVWLLEKGVIR